MKRMLWPLGWILTALLIVAVSLLARHVQQQREQIDELTARLAKPPRSAASAPPEVIDLGARPAEDATTAPPELAPVLPPDINAADLLKNLLVSKTGAKTGANPLANLFEGAQGEQMAEMGAKMTVNMQYGDLFRDLGLTPEKEGQVRDILHRSFAQMMKSGMSILQGGQDFAQVGGDFETAEAQMYDELAQVLSEDELAQFKEYQNTLPERMLDQSYDMQLRMFGGGLSDENREVVKQVLVEELAGAGPDPMRPPNPEEMQNQSSIHSQAYARVLERLFPSLPPDQYAAVERFVQQQQDMINAMSGMFEGLIPKPVESGVSAGSPETN